MATDDEARELNPRTMQSLRGTNRPGGTNKPGRTNKPGGTNKPHMLGGIEQPSEEVAREEDEGKAQPVVFTERLKSGYSTARNANLQRLWCDRQSKGQKWEHLGPDNLGGRVTCLIAIESKPPGNSLLAGAACGGLWNGKVEDRRTEQQKADNTSAPNLHCEWNENEGKPKNCKDKIFLMHNVGALATDGKTIYCGTGHAYNAGDSFPGVGLFRSKDNGKTWKFIKQAGNDFQNGKDFPERISTIAIDGKHVWVGGVVIPEEQEDDSEAVERSGIFYSADDGETWHRQTFKLDPGFAKKFALSLDDQEGIFEDRLYQCHSIVFLGKDKSSTANIILAAITARLGWGGIWRSKDGGKTWEQLTRGLPSPREFGRTSLAVAEKDRNTAYAFIGAADGRCLGVYRSSDAGEHWVSRDEGHFAAVAGLNYVNCLAVSPADSDVIICGARDLHRSVDGGQTWTQVTEWFAAPDSTGYSHADHHALLWPVKERLYSANDGGVDVSHDNGVTWRNLTRGLAVAMFYDIDVAASFGSKNSPNLIIAGGTQDNASIMTDFTAKGIGYVPTCTGLQLGLTQPMAGGAADELAREPEAIVTFRGSGMTNILSGPDFQLLLSARGNPRPKAKPARNFIQILYGDGGWTVFDPHDPLHVYGSSQNMTIYRHRRDNGWQEVTPLDASEDERGGIWMAILAIHPNDPNIIFTGSTRVWRTNDDGVDWRAVSDDLDGSPITAIEIADADPNFIYVGTENGNIFKSTDGGNRWTDEPGEYEPKPMEWRTELQERLTIGVARTITRIEADPKNPKKIAVTLMGFDRKYLLPHVLYFDGDIDENGKKRAENKKKEWIDLTDAHLGEHAPLPNVHYNVVTWDKEGEYLFVGNDIGVWALKANAGTFEKRDGKYDWHDISANLPNAIVTDLVYHCKTNSLVAATYGRSLWRAEERAWRP